MSEIYVGKTLEGEEIALPDSIRTGHVQIVGATGRGKTESVIFPWFMQDTMQGKLSILIDGKGDRELLERVKNSLAEEELNTLVYLDLGDLKNSFVTNPLLYGSPQQIVDRIFSTFVFEKEYFKNISREAVFLVVRILKVLGETVTFRRIFELLEDEEKLTEALGSLQSSDSLLKTAERFLAQPRNARLEKISGLMAQLSPFATGELSGLVNGVEGEDKFFSLAEIIAPMLNPKAKIRTGIILIPQLLYQEMAARLGKMLLQEIAWAVGFRESSGFRSFTSLFLDEFGSFVYEGFLGLLNKARSTNTAIHLSHQSLGDIEVVSPSFATALHTNTNVKCILGVNDPKTADFFAKHFGTRKSEKKTERAKVKGYFSDPERTGEMSVREVEEYKIDPNNLRTYSRGIGALSMIVNGEAFVEEVQFSCAPF
ncbi:MAG: TraM recognition domain-containing protein [Oligoflexia bacterium]|nr:TraM recognition domain-containing protein [Oligoflexia bacterium]